MLNNRTGPDGVLLAAGTPAIVATALTAFQAQGNKINIIVTTAGGGGAGTLTITAKTSQDGGTTYADVVDGTAAWTITNTVINTAGVYDISLEGLITKPGEYVKLYYKCTNAAGTIAINYINWDDISGSSLNVSVPAVTVDIGQVQVSTDVMDDWDATQGSDVGDDGCMQMLEVKNIDGSALPNTTTEGKAIRQSATICGAALVSVINEDGSYIMPTADAVWRSLYAAIGDGTTTAVVETDGTKKALNVNVTDGTNDMPTMDANTRAGFVQVTDGTTEVDVIATINSLKSDLSSISGTATDVNSGNKSDGSQRVVIATDDVNMAAINTATADIPNVIGTTGSAGPAKTLSIAGTDGSGNIRELSVDTDGELQVDVLTLPGGLTAYAEDAAHTTGDKGIQTLAVRSDTAATTADTDGDYTPLLTDANGRLHVIDQNSASIKTSVEIIDDWDESDRAKVNLIVGQAGISANAGTMDAATVRTTLATDDTHYGTVGAAADVDGVVHGQLRFIGEAVDGLETDISDIKTAAQLIDDIIYVDDGAWVDSTSKHALVGGLYQSTPQTVTDGKVAPLQVDVNGKLIESNSAGILADTNVLAAWNSGSNQCNVDIAAQSLTALKVSKDASANAANNPIYNHLTDGTTAISKTNALNVGPGSIGSGYKVYSGSGTATHDVNTNLGRNGNQGYIVNDGAADFTIQIGESGAPSGEDSITLKNGEVFSLDGMNVNQIKITNASSANYRIFVK